MTQHINGLFFIKIPSNVTNPSLARAVMLMLTHTELPVFGASLWTEHLNVAVTASAIFLFQVQVLQRSWTGNNHDGKQWTKKFTLCFLFGKLICLLSSLGLDLTMKLKNMQLVILFKHIFADITHGQKPWILMHRYYYCVWSLINKSIVVHELQTPSRSRVSENHKL